MEIKFMKEALKEAKKAYAKGETPVGAVIVRNGEIIARGHNSRELDKSSLSHAEIKCIAKACKKLDSWRLIDCDIYITLEPCMMCSGAIINSRIKRVFYGASDRRFGCHSSISNLFCLPLNHKVNVTGGIMENECGQIMSDFFRELREKAEW